MFNSKIEIIYSDDDIIVINKPAGLSVTKDRSGLPELKNILSKQLSRHPAKELRLIHRLDKDTSGVMILAKNAEAQSKFSSYFQKRFVQKTYLALVSGAVIQSEGQIQKPLASLRKNTQRMCIDYKKGKKSITEWKFLADFGQIALLAVKPVTGRRHQIRVHLPSIGLPLVIDPLYGSSGGLFLSSFKKDYRLGKGKTEKPLIDRLTLHAYQIEIPHTENSRPDFFIAGLDEKFSATVKMLTKHNPNGIDAFTDTEYFTKITQSQRL